MLKKRRLIAALATIVGLCAPMVGSGKAHAYICCKWPYNSASNLYLNLNYVNYGDPFLGPLVDNAASTWSATHTPVILNANGSGPITVAAGTPQCGNCGGYTSISGSPIQSASIVMNESYLKASASQYQSGLVIHEFGHALGLAHADGSGCTSVMYSNLTLAHATTSPAGYDVSELNRAYPNSTWPPSGAC